VSVAGKQFVVELHAVVAGAGRLMREVIDPWAVLVDQISQVASGSERHARDQSEVTRLYVNLRIAERI
jgi:hypothetical protein